MTQRLTDDQVAELRADVRQYAGLEILVSTTTLAALLEERDALRARVENLDRLTEAALAVLNASPHVMFDDLIELRRALQHVGVKF